jgi:thiamine pyrophosphokinase
MSRALIFANGELIDPGAARGLVQPDDLIIAADGGARHALALGIIPSAIIGDMDSLSPSEVSNFADMDVHLLRFPQAKDETDLELALDYALRAGHNPIIIIAALGGRLDQLLGNIAMLTSPEALQADVRLDDGLTEAFFVTRKASIYGKSGDAVSFIAWGVPAEGVSTDGLAYPLHKESLSPYRTRSISNQMLAETAKVSLKSGLLLCVHIRKK